MSDIPIAQNPQPVARPETPELLNVPTGILRQMQDFAYFHPRNLSTVRDNCLAELEIVPDLAARSYYSIPYNLGKKNETRVEGPSIKAAMTMLRNFGNSINGGRVSDEDKSNFFVEGLVLDLQANVITMRPIRVSKFYKPSGGQGVIPKNADMLYNSVQAGISKAIRNSILATVPDWLVHEYFTRAKEIVINPPSKQMRSERSIQQRIVDGKNAIMKSFGVTPEELNTYVQSNLDAIEDDASLLIHLQGLFNSLKDGEYTVVQVFNRATEERKAPTMPVEKVDVPS